MSVLGLESGDELLLVPVDWAFGFISVSDDDLLVFSKSKKLNLKKKNYLMIIITMIITLIHYTACNVYMFM